MGRSSPDLFDAPDRREAAQLLLEGISVMVALAQELSADELSARLLLAREEALRQLSLLTPRDRPTH